AVLAILGGCLGHGRGGALRHRLAVRHIVSVAEQRIDDLADRILGSIAPAGSLLGVAVAGLAGVGLRDLLVLRVGRLLRIILRPGRSRERSDRRRGGENMGTNCHWKFPWVSTGKCRGG